MKDMRWYEEQKRAENMEFFLALGTLGPTVIAIVIFAVALIFRNPDIHTPNLRVSENYKQGYDETGRYLLPATSVVNK